MQWLIEAVRADPIKLLSMLISAVALGVSAFSLRQSMKAGRKVLEANHLPNLSVELRFEPHRKDRPDEKHLHFFFENKGGVRALD